MTVYIGTAGWSVPRQDAARGPADGSHLQRYAQVLNAAEINSSFYRPHKRATYVRWAASVPADFRFAVKLPKAISHAAGLVGCDAALAAFADEVGGLGEKLGVLLVQTPPRLAFDAAAAADFFTRCAALWRVPVACEPRHASWFTPQADALLAAQGVARVAADPAPVPAAAAPGGARALVYLRLHGSPRIYYSDYDASALARVRHRIAAHAAAGTPVWCIFDNTAASAAFGNALTLADLLAR